MKTSYLTKQIIGTFIFFSVIFISAGTVKYWQGLTYVAIGIVMFILGQTVFSIDKQLQEERSKPGEGTKKWDKAILGLSFFATIGMYVVAGLDSGRFHWSPDQQPSVFFSGIILTVTGQLLFLIAQKQNKFFSSTVRIQTERGHTVCNTGLYKMVRHPAYLGSLIQAAGFPLLFGSVWSVIPAAISIILLIVRTHLEDKTLRVELSGYNDYSLKTKNRLIPFLW